MREEIWTLMGRFVSCVDGDQVDRFFIEKTVYTELLICIHIETMAISRLNLCLIIRLLQRLRD